MLINEKRLSQFTAASDIIPVSTPARCTHLDRGAGSCNWQLPGTIRCTAAVTIGRTGCGLVQEEQRRLDESLARNAQPPLLPAREAFDESCAHRCVGGGVQAQRTQDAVHALPPLRRWHFEPACATLPSQSC